MIWLIGHLWPFMLLAAVLGAVLTTVFSTRTVTVERWVATPAAAPDESEDPAEARLEEPAPSAAGAGTRTEPSSPFPVAVSAGEPAPWEQEELWSRPAKLASPSAARGQVDEWDDAAQNWRSWADEASGKAPTPTDVVADGDRAAGGPDRGAPRPSDRDLFAADRDLFAADRDAEQEDPFPHAAPVEAFRYDRPVDSPLPRSDEPFPFARPVEAASLPPTDPFPSFGAAAAEDDEQDARSADDRA